ncbi:MAG: 30S ribosomal protein S2 [Planctomycetota bacterium]
MDAPNVRELIKAGFHFGHRTSRWNPKMESYIFKRRNLIHIIDLRETLRGLLLGGRLARAVARRGGDILFVGTKKQAREAVEREAKRCGMPYVAERWPGGLLTNYVTIRQRLERLEELEELERTGQIQLYSKKMVSSLRREKRKILRNLGGVREMEGLPELLILVDPAEESIAVKEADKLEIPMVALTDTDGDPQPIDVVVPGNDDSIGAIEIFLETMAEAVLEARTERGEVVETQAAETPEPSAEAEEEQPAPEAETEEAPETEPEPAEPAASAEAEEGEQPAESPEATETGEGAAPEEEAEPEPAEETAEE